MNAAAIEAGLLRACETVLYGALVAGFQAAIPLLNATAPAAVDWPSVTHTFLVAMLTGALMGMRQYHATVGAGIGPAADAPAPADPAPSAVPSEPAGGVAGA